MHTTQNSIPEFLLNLKLILASGNTQDDRFIFVTRLKNKETLLRLGITPTNVKQIIIDLTPQDYKSGPENDENPAIKGEIWVFQKEIEGLKIYIKLSVRGDDAYHCVRCISFHPSEIV